MTCVSSLQDDGKLNVEEAVHAILGRKRHRGRPLRIEDLPALMKTNTASLQDGVKIMGHYERYRDRKERPRGKVRASLGDGQSVLLMSYLKRHWPELYKQVLVLGGGFHA